MSYAICRVQKIGSGSAVAGIQIHNQGKNAQQHQPRHRLHTL